MKTSVVLLVGSLAVNSALAMFLWQRPAGLDFFHALPATTAGGANVSAATPAMQRAGDTRSPDATESWADLTNGELPEILARLRADGVPPRLVRTIMGALVAQRFADRHRAIVAAMTAKPWWEGQPYEPYNDPKITAMRRQLAKEEREALYALLGPETPASEYDRLWREHRYGNLSPDQIEKFRSINQDYADLMAETRDLAKGIILPGDREKLAFLEDEKRKDIEKLLTPDERFEFELRSSATAKRLRDQLAVFEPTEEEFRAIFQVHAAIDAQYAGGRVQNLTQEERRQRRDAINAADAQIQRVLSPERFAAYQQAVAGRPGAPVPKK